MRNLFLLILQTSIYCIKIIKVCTNLVIINFMRHPNIIYVRFKTVKNNNKSIISNSLSLSNYYFVGATLMNKKKFNLFDIFLVNNLFDIINFCLA